MHFFYLDESGCTGTDLENQQQPIFALGGLSIRDEGWNQTQEAFSRLISNYFEDGIPPKFELHAADLLSPKGKGFFKGHDIELRLNLARSMLALVAERKHDIHLFAIHKKRVLESHCEAKLAYDPKVPYLTAFDYLITYINEHVRNKLGRSARGMVIIDEKDTFHSEIEAITRTRRFEGAVAHRVKWIVEFSYPVDSRKNPMIQISDLIVYCARRFMELEHGYKDDWPGHVKTFYAQAYHAIHGRISKKQLVQRAGKDMDKLNGYLEAIRCEPVGQWRKRYGV